ncbi:MarR family transcriptional regulator [Halopseudomonas oceani]|uniref:MarR family winged helix-turn-helix transcriptional regulator n=1 Tax=Halopseudomonas oceani TaxID=1708783 RepID=UPI002AA73785|nr:MarR family transcriptional regulator [Halopseudomonas oceani]
MSDKKESRLVSSVIGLNSNIQKRVGRALSVHGIGVTEYLVLNQLYVAPTQTMRRSDLAEEVGLSPSGITRLINPMEKIGLVKKEESPRDARVSLVRLSAAGKQVYEDAQVSFEQASVALFEPLDDKQIDAFIELLSTVSKGA